jgi:hypothetical protein
MSESWIDRGWKDVIKEHPAIGGKSNKGKRTSDLCISMPLLSGAESRAIFLIEQQHLSEISDKCYTSILHLIGIPRQRGGIDPGASCSTGSLFLPMSWLFVSCIIRRKHF